MVRAKAERRAKRAGKTSSSLWGFENWANEGTEAHHLARTKYGDLLYACPSACTASLPGVRWRNILQTDPIPTIRWSKMVG